MKTIHQEFNATLLNMDEGILSTDTVLAAALWRSVLGPKLELQPQVLELLVHYVRVQTAHLSRIKSERIVLLGDVDWKPFAPLI